MFKTFDDGKVVFDGKLTEEAIKAFVKENKVPLLDEIGPDNFMSYVESGVPLAYLFLDDNNDRAKLQEEIRPLAKEFRGKVNFVWIDATKYSGHAANLNLEETWPAFAIQEPVAHTKFPMDQKILVNADNVRVHVDKFLKGEISPNIKSEPIPEKNDEPVKVVVSKQYEEIVMDKDKDVLIEFYAPWCGHCKKLAPIYDSLATKLVPHNAKIVIAKMDATVNDVPANAGFQVSGFPTIKLVKAVTNEVVDYDGDRTEEAFIAFLQENATNKFELAEEKKEEKPAEQVSDDKKEAKEEKKEEVSDKKEHDEL